LRNRLTGALNGPPTDPRKIYFQTNNFILLYNEKDRNQLRAAAYAGVRRFLENHKLKKSESKIGIPIHIDDREPEIDDPLESPKSTYWFPANTISIKLMPCVESIRDIGKLLETINKDNGYSDKRLHKLLASPVYSLARGVESLFNEIEGNAKNYGQISTKQQKEIKKRFVQFSKDVPLQKDDALRIIRDRLGAHVDKEVFMGDSRKIWELVEIDSLLEWIRTTLDALHEILEYDIFAWTRESGDPKVFRLMSIDGMQVDSNLEDKEIVGFSLARSPKYYVSNLIQKVSKHYAEIQRNNA